MEQSQEKDSDSKQMRKFACICSVIAVLFSLITVAAGIYSMESWPLNINLILCAVILLLVHFNSCIRKNSNDYIIVFILVGVMLFQGIAVWVFRFSLPLRTTSASTPFPTISTTPNNGTTPLMNGTTTVYFGY
ncbi:uncharacterized protein LOC123528009 [Mercenaria mercenaria]|uniref:uncharacterized protein LOC123528009 n=1 Tax=Mercenaria mercenaria TaxID=6596 RepID=UPI00234EF9DA|nr:uncharacterized protein LOC123528009 [Mercenaria mercenaria]